jgi:hypothetical protein
MIWAALGLLAGFVLREAIEAFGLFERQEKTVDIQRNVFHHPAT